MPKKTLDQIDFSRINTLLEGFNKATGFVTAILDLEGNVLSRSGWRRICTEFHRVNPETAKKCTISDTILAGKMAEGEKYHFYKCLNGLVDVAVPIVIKGEHIANLFTGQFFFGEPDRKFFLQQATDLKFNSENYLKALEEVPVFTEEQVRPALDFLLNMTEMIAEMTVQRLEQIKLTEALRESEERVRLSTEISNVAIWEFDFNTNSMTRSKNHDQLYGLEPQDKWEFVTFLNATHPDDRGYSNAIIQKSTEPGGPDQYQFDFRVVYPDNSVHWLAVTGHIVSRNADGRAVTVRGTLIDITERKETELEKVQLLESEKSALAETEKAKEQLSQILERINDGFGSLDRDWNYTYVNEKLAQNVGKKREELLGQNIWKVFPQAIGTQVHKAYLRAMEEQVAIDLEHFYPHFGRWFQHRFYPSHDGLSVFSRDITESKLAEEKLKENSTLIRIAAEKAKLGGWNVILNENRSYWSDGVAAIHEMPPGYSPLVEDGINFYAPEWRDRISKVFTDCAQKGIPYDEEMEILTSTGKRVWVRTIGEAVRDENGKIFMVHGAFQDISEKKAAIDRIREKDHQFRKLSANVPDLIFQFTRKPDGSYCVPVASEGIRNIFGCSPEDVLDDFSPIAKVIYPDDAERVIADIEYSAKNLTYFTCEFRVQIPGRPVQWIFSRSTPEKVADGSITWYGFNADITGHKDAENQIKSLNERLELLIEAIQQLSVSASMDKIMSTVRTYARKLVNADGSTFILQEGDMCYYADEDSASHLWKGQRFPLRDCISGWAMINRQPVIIEDIYADDRVPVEAYKSTYVKSLAIAPIRLNDPLGAIGTYWSKNYKLSDVEIKLLNSLADAAAIAVENVQLIEGLEIKIEERTSQLLAANEELEAFSYSVSHDLRAPLRHINGYVDMLNTKYYEMLDDKGRHYLETISGASRKMGTLIDDLLQFSRTGRKELSRTRLDFNMLIKEVLKELEPVVKGRNIEWDIQVLPVVLGDYTLLKLVWSNLIDNALKYTRNQEIARITIGYKNEAKNFIFCITDNGVGFDMKYAHKLYGVFQRLHSQTEFEGTGIGLANVQRIIHKHSGLVWAEAEKDKGASFFFSLPKIMEEKL